MKKHFQRLKDKISRRMRNCYGVDELSGLLILASIAFMILAAVPLLRRFTVIAWILLLLSLIRSMSKNPDARRAELNKYNHMKKKTADKIFLWKQIRQERKTHCYFKCKNCGAVLRVPKGRGEIVVTCPKCQSKIDKKT